MKYVYALVDPRDGETRYVGCASDPDARLASHLWELDNLGPSNDRLRWLYELREYGYSPTLTVLEEVGLDWRSREKYWISQFPRLTNIHPGGGGGWELGAEARAHQIESTRSPAHVLAVKASNVRRTGERRRSSPGVSDANRLRVWTPEMRLKLSEARRRRVNSQAAH